MVSTGLPTVARTLIRRPCATYRVQLRAGMTLDGVRALVPYLGALGITDVYLSPILRAREHSDHGYDVCDPSVIDESVGTEDDLRQLSAALATHGLGLILDFVPNHMATDEGRNPWWQSLLRHGLDSPVAHYFDVDWDPPVPHLRRRILLPILDAPYGRVLESGALVPTRSEKGTVLRYGTRELPLAAADDLDIDALAGTAGDPASFDALHSLLERQPYRLAYWRTSADELNYRRFFDVDDLVGLRVEAEDVFTASHAYVLELVASGLITGLRIDHPDGLACPREYFDRLANSVEAVLATRTVDPPHDARAIYTIVEKILVGDEMLPDDWSVDGTTGYEFLAAVNGVCLARRAHADLARVYARFAGRRIPFGDLAREAKRQVMETLFAGEVDRLTAWLEQCSERSRSSRDLTWRSLRRALIAMTAALRVYRTYVTPMGPRADDRRRLDQALADAIRLNPAVDPAALEFIHQQLTMTGPPPAVLAFAHRFQQFSGAVFAKAIEDTAFYRDNTLVSLNEVGSNPARPGQPVAAFHTFNERRLAHTPLALSATATHDTKLGEDARARLNALSEMTGAWRTHLWQWRAHHHAHRSVSPDRHDEYRFYQALVAVWPAGAATPTDTLADRLTAYMIKSTREAKRRTSWTAPNEEYEQALVGFVSKALSDTEFIASIASFAGDVARVGVINSLSQTVLKMTSPGVPDFYQGTEGWDLHLVDPDNRTLPDFQALAERLREIETIHEIDSARKPHAIRGLLDTWTDARIKLLVITAGLRFRRLHQDLFASGTYRRLTARPSGHNGDVVSFVRQRTHAAALTVVPRVVAGLMRDGGWPLGDAWLDRALELPAALATRSWRNVVTDERLSASQRLPLSKVFQTCPVAILEAV